jgi:D-threonate/D-erythronate kinase
MDIGIIADDLTSATDAGIQFARVGYTAEIQFNNPEVPVIDPDVLSIDIDSRRQCGLEAGAAAKRASTRIKTARIVFKTVDSTLRGHIGIELAAVLQGTGRRRAIMAPAFPSARRITRDGMQFLHGRPVHETEFKHDPLNPVENSCIASLLTNSGISPVANLGRPQVLYPQLIRAALVSAQCIVADAETDEDLQTIVRAVGEVADICWAGSPGLARALGEVYPAAKRTAPEVHACRGVLVVVGSLNAVSRQQLAHLLVSDTGIGLDTDDLSAQRTADATDDVVRLARLRLGQRKPVVLFSRDCNIATNTPARLADSARATADAFAEIARRLIHEGVVDGLVVTGGDTATAVLRRLDATGIRLERELEAGIPIGRITGPHPVRIITKAGGFGRENTLARACEVLFDGSASVESSNGESI